MIYVTADGDVGFGAATLVWIAGNAARTLACVAAGHVHTHRTGGAR